MFCLYLHTWNGYVILFGGSLAYITPVECILVKEKLRMKVGKQ